MRSWGVGLVGVSLGCLIWGAGYMRLLQIVRRTPWSAAERDEARRVVATASYRDPRRRTFRERLKAEADPEYAVKVAAAYFVGAGIAVVAGAVLFVAGG